MEEWCKIQTTNSLSISGDFLLTYQQQSSADPILTKFILELITFSSMPKQFSFFSNTNTKYIFWCLQSGISDLCTPKGRY